MRMVSIASGSSGNRIYIGSDDIHILVDAGVSNKRIQQELSKISLSGDGVNGVLITHKHSNHIRGLGVLSRKCHVPVYDARETLDGIASSGNLGGFGRGPFTPVCLDVDFTLRGLNVKPFKIGHDAANPVAYKVSCGDKSMAVTTDMRHFDQCIIGGLQGLDALLLKSNHDVRTLETGPCPYYPERRILGDHGHLSDESTGRLLNCVLHNKLKKAFSGYLSRENNYEELTYETARLEIDEGDCPYGASDFSISVTGRDHMSEIVYL